MFKKLRNKFLIINIIAITAVLLSSFLAIFFMTLNNVKTDVTHQLNNVFTNHSDNRYSESIIFGDFSDYRTLAFWVELDIHKNPMVYYIPNFWTDMGQMNKDVGTLLQKSLKSSKTSSYFKEGNHYYAYKLIPTISGYRIGFLDITNNVKVLQSFISSFILVSAASGVVIFIFSKYAADKAIKPIGEAYDMQKQFVLDASHELKTPLTIINANVDLMMKQPLEDHDKNLSYIKHEGERMSNLVNDLLTLSKLEQTQDELVYSKLKLSQLLEESILPIEALIYEKHLSLDVSIEPNLYVKGNDIQLKQVILILMDNAIKYCSDNGDIIVRLHKDSKAINLSVENTSETLSDDDLKNVFERFYRVDPSRNKSTGGFGLGLSIAKNIMDVHKGDITMASYNNKVKVQMEFPSI